MAAQARILTISVPTEDTTTAFQVQYAPGGSLTWTAYNPGGGADIDVSELTDDEYVLDGVNGTGNSSTASQEGNWYQIRLKSGSLYGTWSAPFRIGAPTAQDLVLRLTGMGITTYSVDLMAAAADGLAEFETATGRAMLAVSGTRTFPPPDIPTRVLDFREDLYGYPTALSIAGTAYARDTDYRLLDPNAYLRGKPYWGAKFLNLFSVPVASPWWNAVSVTGLWGYGTTIPNDAFDAMVAIGLLKVLPDLGIEATGVLNRWVEAEVTEDYGPEAYGTVITRLEKRVASTIAKYARVQVGLGA